LKKDVDEMICDHISLAFKPNEYISIQIQNLRDPETLKSEMRKSSVESLKTRNKHGESQRIH